MLNQEKYFLRARWKSWTELSPRFNKGFSFPFNGSDRVHQEIITAMLKKVLSRRTFVVMLLSIGLMIWNCFWAYDFLNYGFLDVPFHVQRQMIAAWEAPVAVTTLEGLGAGVLSVVTGELVASSEAPFAAFPTAVVRLLSWKQTKTEITLMKSQPKAFQPRRIFYPVRKKLRRERMGSGLIQSTIWLMKGTHSSINQWVMSGENTARLGCKAIKSISTLNEFPVAVVSCVMHITSKSFLVRKTFKVCDFKYFEKTLRHKR